MSGGHEGGGLRAWQLALRTNRPKPCFFQATLTPRKRPASDQEQQPSLMKKGRKQPSTTKPSGPASSAGPKKSEKRCKAELMVIEEGDDIPDEQEPLLGHVVWAPFGSFHSYHAALVIKGSMVNLATADATQAFVYWFSDGKVSAVARSKLVEFVPHFRERGVQSGGKRGQHGLIKALEELQRRAGAVSPSVVDMDPLQWALLGFPAENDCHITPAPDVCIGCADPDRKVVCQHPLFEGGLCSKCKEVLQETFYAVGEDGTHSFCAVCGAGGQLFVCDNAVCGRVYCVPCVEELGGEDVLRKVKDTPKWACFLCQSPGGRSHGLVKPRRHWQQDLVLFFDVGHRTAMVPDLDYFKTRRPIRVLSLFDGIGTGLLALQRAGLQVEVYYASETDEQAALVAQANHGALVTQLGDVVALTKDRLAEVAPIDLLIGGSPCNELSLANPLRKGFDVEGSGVLFFDFYRILRDLVALNGDRHLFWMYENVASMRTAYRAVISRFLQCQPAVWDAKHLSAQKRSRFFWGNIPGLYSTPEVSDSLRQQADLNSVLTQQCNRRATVPQVRTITTQAHSLLQGSGGGTLPVSMAGAQDTLWLSELERLFGFPAHYTDVSNLPPTKRRALLGRSWSVQVVTEILRPLTQYFASTGTAEAGADKDAPVSRAPNDSNSDSKTPAVDDAIPAPSVSDDCGISSTDRALEGVGKSVDGFDMDTKLFSSVDNKTAVKDSEIAEVCDGDGKDDSHCSDGAVCDRKEGEDSDVSLATSKGTTVSVTSFTDVSNASMERAGVSPFDKKTDVPATNVEDVEVASAQVKDVNESDSTMKDADSIVVDKGLLCSGDIEDTDPSGDDSKEATDVSVACCTSKVVGGASVVSAITHRGRSAHATSAKDQTASVDKARKKSCQSEPVAATVSSTDASSLSGAGNGAAASTAGDNDDISGDAGNDISATARTCDCRPPMQKAAVVSSRHCGDSGPDTTSAGHPAEKVTVGGGTSELSVTKVCRRIDTGMTSVSPARDLADQAGTDTELGTQARCSTCVLQSVSRSEPPCQDQRPSTHERKGGGCMTVKTPEILENVQVKGMHDAVTDVDPDVNVSICQSGERTAQTDDGMECVPLTKCCGDSFLVCEELDGSDQLLCSSDTILVLDSTVDGTDASEGNCAASLSVTRVDSLADHDHLFTDSGQEQEAAAGVSELHQYYCHEAVSQEQRERMNPSLSPCAVTELFPQRCDSSDNAEGQQGTGMVRVCDAWGKRESGPEMTTAGQDSRSQDSLPEWTHSGLTDSHRYLLCDEELVKDESDFGAQTKEQMRNPSKISKDSASAMNAPQHANCMCAFACGQENYPEAFFQSKSTPADDVPESKELKSCSLMPQNSAGFPQQPVSVQKSPGEAKHVHLLRSCSAPPGQTGCFLVDASHSSHTAKGKDQFSAGGQRSTFCHPPAPKGARISLPSLENPGNIECTENVGRRIDHHPADEADMTVQQSEGEENKGEVVRRSPSQQSGTQREQHQFRNTDITCHHLSCAQEGSTLSVEGKQPEQISSEWEHEKTRIKRESCLLQNLSETEDCTGHVKNNTCDQNLRSAGKKLKPGSIRKYQTRSALKCKSEMPQKHQRGSAREIPDDKIEVILRPKLDRRKQSLRAANRLDDMAHVPASFSHRDDSKTGVDGSVITSEGVGDTATTNRPPTGAERSACPVLAETAADDTLGTQVLCGPLAWSAPLKTVSAHQDQSKAGCGPLAWSAPLRTLSAHQDQSKAACGIFNQTKSGNAHQSKTSNLHEDNSKGIESVGIESVPEKHSRGYATCLCPSSPELSWPAAGVSSKPRQHTSTSEQGQAAPVCQQATSSGGLGQERLQRSSFHRTSNVSDKARMVKSSDSDQREHKIMTRRQSRLEESKRIGCKIYSEAKVHVQKSHSKMKDHSKAKGDMDTVMQTKRGRLPKDINQQQVSSSVGGPARSRVTSLDGKECRPQTSDRHCTAFGLQTRSQKLSARSRQSAAANLGVCGKLIEKERMKKKTERQQRKKDKSHS
ncbi:hypothetical protein ACOMHN_023684 [Nucella lapillus]